MKFGRTLPHAQVPEWASAYINYKGLKKLIKSATRAAEKGEKVDLAEFFFALDRNLEQVDNFYNKKFSENLRRLDLLRNRYGRIPDVADLDGYEVEELYNAAIDLRKQFRKLQYYGEINHKGFVKITKKLDKKVPKSSATQHRYIATKVEPRAFAKPGVVVRLQEDITSWLTALSEAKSKGDDDDGSERSYRSLERASAQVSLALPRAVLDKLDQATRDDRAEELDEKLKEVGFAFADPPSQALLLSLLQRSITARARASMKYLLARLEFLDEPKDLNARNCIHRLVIHIGRDHMVKFHDEEAPSYPFASDVHYASQYPTPVASPPTSPPAERLLGGALDQSDQVGINLLAYLLDHVTVPQRSALIAKDNHFKTPLHFAAQYGCVKVCKMLLSKMREWKQLSTGDGADAAEWYDKDGNTPLHLAVIGGHALTTQALLEISPESTQSSNRRHAGQSSAVLAIATKCNFKRIVRILVAAGMDINWQDEIGETALHLAARFGREECARILIEGTIDQKANLELTEKTYAWAPIHIAAVDGFFSLAQLLVDSGANVDKLDSDGWSAQEHAALRGHMEIAKLLKQHSLVGIGTPLAVPEDSSATLGVSPPKGSSLEDRYSSNGTKRHAEPVKTFGHRYLTGESLVLVSLGSMDMRKGIEPVKLDRVPMNEAHTTQLDTALSVVVSAVGAKGESTIIDLPVHENISTEPIAFTTKDAAEVRLHFDIVPTYSGNEKNKIGRGVAMLSSIRPSLGSKRMILQGDVCVPIMAASLDVIGTISFNFLVVTPFTHANMEVTSKQTYWKKLASTMVIGHRGLGKNITSNRSLQLGENTVPSFIAAANLGAQYVEFDVQLTKDHVPVIYHDFLVSETGIDAPVHTLTLEQFLHINPDSRRAAKSTNGGSSQPNGTAIHKQLNRVRNNEPGPRPRSMSVGYGIGSVEDTEKEERMRHTRDYKEKGFKANSRGNFIQAPFATLEDLFRELPAEIGFNIEMKYPMLHESEEHDMDAYAVELNSFCDTVLTKVYDLAGKKHIIFSSFNPDICLCLNFKQPNFPIMFLTDAGTCPVGDIRASSLQEAIRFASRWNLLGIVSNSEPFTNSPRLVRVVKENGLICVSYGSENNDPSLVRRQVAEGVDAVIVDNVLAIRQGLTEVENEARHKEAAAAAAAAVTDVKVLDPNVTVSVAG